MDDTNAYYIDTCKNMIVEHLVKLRGHNCFFAAGRDRTSGKMGFFLFFEKMEKIFYRPGKDKIWEEIHERQEYRWIRNLLYYALIHRQMGSLRQHLAQAHFKTENKEAKIRNKYLKFNLALIIGGFLLLGIQTQSTAQQTDPLPLVKGIFSTIPLTNIIPAGILNNPYVAGVSVRVKWSELELQEGFYDWTPIDSKIAQAAAAGKAVLLQVTPASHTPDWVYAAGAQSFQYIDSNPYHDTFCKEVAIPVPWDEVYLTKWTNFIQALGQRYSNDPRITYIRAVGGSNAHSGDMNLPNSLIKTVSNFDGTVTCTTYDDIANWKAIGYTSDKVIGAWKRILDSFGSAFPNHWITTPVAPVNIKDSLLKGMTVPLAVADYGYLTLGNRFMISRNSVSAVMPEPPPPADSQYALIWDHHPQIFLQMLWNTTGDATCRNNGQVCDYNMDSVVDSQDSYLIFQDAVQTAMLYQTQVLEVYPQDIQNPAFQSILADASVHMGPTLFGNITFNDVGGTHLAISWETDEPSMAQAAYGLTASYGLTSSMDSAVSTTHRIIMTGLAPGTTYHFQINSWDSANNLATSQDLIATTTPNQAPVLTAIANKAVDEGQLLSFTVSASDPDGDPLMLSARQANGEPVGSLGAVFTDQGNGTGTFNWNPGFIQAGEYIMIFTATDGILTTDEIVTITVADVNRPPVLSAIGDKNVNEGSNLAFTIGATDPDGNTLTYSATGLPSGASLNASTGAFSWTPGFSQSGSYLVTLTVSDGSLNASETINVTVADVNQPPVLVAIGNKSLSEGSNLAFTISATDPDGDALTYSVMGLPAGAAFTGETFNWTPSFTQSGTYLVTFIVSDGTLSVSETIIVRVEDVPVPDLIVSSFSTTTTAVAPGNGFTLSDTAANQGTASAGNFTVAFSLSKDAIYGGTDDIAFSATRSISSLAAGSSSGPSPTSLTVPATTPLGNYYVCAKVDNGNAVTESEETNNSRCTTTTIQVALPDLVMTAISGPASGITGANVSFSSTVRNQGISSANSFSVGFYLSTDATITTGDLRIGIRGISNLAPGATSSATTTLIIPPTLAAGTYYIGAIADYTNTCLETSEINNALTGNTITLTIGADLVMSSVSGPVSAAKGTSIVISDTVKNQGTGESGGFYVGLYLSTDATITTSDRLIGNRHLSTLAAGGLNIAGTTVTIPTTVTAGTYYLGAIADYTNTVKENNETNNAMAGNTIVVQ